MGIAQKIEVYTDLGFRKNGLGFRKKWTGVLEKWTVATTIGVYFLCP